MKTLFLIAALLVISTPAFALTDEQCLQAFYERVDIFLDEADERPVDTLCFANRWHYQLALVYEDCPAGSAETNGQVSVLVGARQHLNPFACFLILQSCDSMEITLEFLDSQRDYAQARANLRKDCADLSE